MSDEVTIHTGEEEEVKVVRGLNPKEIKALARPEFAANPDKFYPTKTLRKLGYERFKCPSCDNCAWRRTPKKLTCGDSNCEKQYTFIGKGTGRGRKGGAPYTYSDAWNGFKKSLTSARIPCTAVDRYPVVARWRADVDFVAAGIFCFQPYCVTGELEPPANPLIQPQFCLRYFCFCFFSLFFLPFLPLAPLFPVRMLSFFPNKFSTDSTIWTTSVSRVAITLVSSCWAFKCSTSATTTSSGRTSVSSSTIDGSPKSCRLTLMRSPLSRMCGREVETWAPRSSISLAA